MQKFDKKSPRLPAEGANGREQHPACAPWLSRPMHGHTGTRQAAQTSRVDRSFSSPHRRGAQRTRGFLPGEAAC